MTIWDKIKEIVNKMFGKTTVEQVLHIKPTISSKMADSIELWSAMYEGNSPWLHEPTYENPIRITSLGIPALIASEKARMATLEMNSEINAPMEEVEVENPDYVPPKMDEVGNMSLGMGTMTKIEEKPKGNTERADFLNEQYKVLKKQIRRQLEYGIAKGGLVIKPIIVMTNGNSLNKTFSSKGKTIANDKSKTSYMSEFRSQKSTSESNIDNNVEAKERNKFNAVFAFDFVQADGFFPLAFDSSGQMVEAAFIQRKLDKDIMYSRIEHHVLNQRDQTVTVTNMAYKSTNANADSITALNFDTELGTEVPLTEVPEWSALEKQITISGVDRLLFAYFKMPEANTIDTYSPLGVSGYSRVVNLIKDADMQYSRLLWEFEGGELAIDVDRDALKLVTTDSGEDITVKPMMQDRLFRKIDLNSEETYNVFAPALRDSSLMNGLNSILMRIEDAAGMSRGTISDTTSTEVKTATELKILKQRSYATNADIQMALEDALKDAVYVMDVYCSLYEVTPEGEYEISFEWDDSILVDSESELAKRLTLMNNGLASKVETRMWYFGETENQAKAALQKIDEENKRAIETNMMAQSQLGEVAQDQKIGAQLKRDNLQGKIDANNNTAGNNAATKLAAANNNGDNGKSITISK